MRQNFNPREYQRTMIDFIIDTPRCAVFAGMGMGKTCGTLTALDILELTEPGPTLVLAPLRVAESTWPDEARKWSHLTDTVVSAVVGSPDERRAALRRRLGAGPRLVRRGHADAWPVGAAPGPRRDRALVPLDVAAR